MFTSTQVEEIRDQFGVESEQFQAACRYHWEAQIVLQKEWARG